MAKNMETKAQEDVGRDKEESVLRRYLVAANRKFVQWD